MRIAITFVFALMVLCVVSSSTVSAQPSVAVYFDANWTQESEVCQGVGIVTFAYVVAQNLNTFFNAIEYQIDYSPVFNYVSWIGDQNSAGTVVGQSPSGVALGWGLPLNGFSPVLVQKVILLWNCNACAGQDVVKVNPHPFTLDPTVIAVEFPSNVKIPMVGMTSLLCAGVATEETTWGKVKSLYGE